MTYNEKWRDDFDGALALKTRPHNGSVVQGGGILTVSSVSGQDSSWPASYLPVLAYLDSPTQGRGLHLAEARLSDFTYTGTECLGGMCLFDSRLRDYVSVGWYPNNSNIYMQRVNNGEHGTVANKADGSPNPTTTPVRLRLLWNNHKQPIRSLSPHGAIGDPEGNYTAGGVWGYYSPDDGVTWYSMGGYTPRYNPGTMHLGFYVRNWGAYPSSDLDFDYLSVSFEDDAKVHVYYPLGNENHQHAWYNTTGFEDKARILTQQGPQKWNRADGEGAGQRLPGRTQQEVAPGRHEGPIPQSGFEDGPLDILTAGGKVQYQSPEYYQGRVGTGVMLPQSEQIESRIEHRLLPQSAWEDRLALLTNAPPRQGLHWPLAHDGISFGLMIPGPPHRGENAQGPWEIAAWEEHLVQRLLDASAYAYSTVQTDGDGNTLLPSGTAKMVKRYRADLDPWGNPTAHASFSGIGRDGKFYRNGEECVFGDFGVTDFRHTSWSIDENPLGNFYDHTYLPPASEIDMTLDSPDVVRFQSNAPLDVHLKQIGSHMRWCLLDSFDIQLDFSDFNGGAVGYSGIYFTAQFRQDTKIVIGREQTGGSQQYRSFKVDGGSFTAYTWTATANAGKLRLLWDKPTGRFTASFDEGGGWQVVASNELLNNVEDAAWVAAYAWGQGSSTIDAKVSNLVVAAGTISTRCGWYREGFGTYRGNKQDFPEKAVLAATQEGIAIIDEDTGLLWAMFTMALSSSGDMLNGGLGYITDFVMEDGVLVVGVASPTAAEGFMVKIDFNMEEAWRHRTSASGAAGAIYKTPGGDFEYGAEYPTGKIIKRNDTMTWSGDYARYGLPHLRVHSVALGFYGGNVYWAAATEAGATIFMLKRWYLWGTDEENPTDPRWANSNEVGKIYWCHLDAHDPVNLRFMYMDGTNLYSVDRTTYELRFTGAFGGGFDAEVTKALGGTRDLDSQYHALQFETKYYIPSNEGIWEIEWPAGTMNLFYGKPGSGAVHEILPEFYTRVVRIGALQDATHDLIVAYLENAWTTRGQVVAVKLSDNSLYCKSPIIFCSGRELEAVA